MAEDEGEALLFAQVGHPVPAKEALDGNGGPLKPGQVFSVDPQLYVPEENLYFRYEDTVVVTETGVENFTAFLPSELEDLERLVSEDGVVQKLGPIPEGLRASRNR